MKKILIAVALIATLGSCSHKPKLYFDDVECKTVNNPEAEFDTLSYALGMNYALYLQLNVPELKYDNELMAQTYIEMLERGFKSFAEIEAARNEFSKYQQSHLAKYMKAKRNRILSHNAIIPEVYDEEFTNTMFTSMSSRTNALELLTHNTPYNAHYIAMAIRDAKGVAADSLINSTMKITVEQMINQLKMKQGNIIAENIKVQADSWMADIATRPGVQALDVNGDTIYYRINSAGGVKPEEKDSIVVNYEVYSFRGRLIESTKSRIKMIKETIEFIKGDKEITDEKRNIFLEYNKEQLAKVDRMVLKDFRIEAIKQCLPLVGEYGSITIWTPAKFGPRSQMLAAGEPVVINIELKRVIEGSNVVIPATPKKFPGKQMPGKVSIEPQQGGKNTTVQPVTLTPATKGEQRPISVKRVAPEKK